MNHYLFLVLFSFLAFNILEAQPQPNAANKGVVSNPKISKVALTDANSAAPYTTPKVNLLVFNTNAKMENGAGEGFYFWNGEKWLPFGQLNLAVTKKMYVGEDTEITTLTARNLVKVEETRRKQVVDAEKKQIAANNAALEKERLNNEANRLMSGGNTDENDVYDDLAGDMEDDYNEGLSTLTDDGIGGDIELPEEGENDEGDLMNIEDDATDADTLKEDNKIDVEKDPDSDDLVKARKSNADTIMTNIALKMPQNANEPAPSTLSLNGKEQPIAKEEKTEIEVASEDKIAKKEEVVTENVLEKADNPILVAEKGEIVSEKMTNFPVKEELIAEKAILSQEPVIAETKTNENQPLASEELKKKELNALPISEKPILKEEKGTKVPEKEAVIAKVETENLIQNEPNNDNTNFMLGKNALSANEHGINNTAVGHQALMGNKIGSENTAIGESALQNNISGNRNIGIGYNSLYSNAFASYNTAVGVNTLQNYSYNNSGTVFNTYNTAFGYAVLMHTNSTNLETGMENTGVGAEALMANTQGKGNTGVGRLSLRNNTRGNFNTALGYEALAFNTVGIGNTALGNGALKYIITGEYNTAIGNNAGPAAANHALENTTAIGYGAITTADNQVRIGNNAVTSIGGYVGWSNLSDGRFKQNVTEDVKGLDFIMQLRPVTYNLDMDALNAHLYGKQAQEIVNQVDAAAKSQVRYTGFIAQEVETAAQNTHFEFSGVDLPQNENGHYGLRYAEFTVPLVKAVQEQQQIIADLQAKIALLEKQNQGLSALAKEVEKMKLQMGMMGVVNESANAK